MHRLFEISEANATQYISNSSGFSRETVACSRFQKTGPVRLRYPNRAFTLIEQSLQQNYCKVCLTYLKFLAMPLDLLYLCQILRPIDSEGVKEI